ncbi:glycosyltransferase [Akkermansiaceae bacterium]|nr:glycosyltransferase [Akkermansiaceae bacterium]MDB4695326.1 glycosyltransferase [Akkermansiaceae bacterium]
MKESIPKIIHYCWFGRGRKPKDTVRYIDGWKTLMPDYQVIEWNEDNFDVHVCPYVKQAYDSKKFAFVSDYARGHALYEMGGIYLDTDVEVLKAFDDLLGHRSLWGFEAGNYIATSTIGTIPRHEMIKTYLDQYHTRTFLKPDETPDQTTNVQVITKLWEQQGVLLNNERQTAGDDNLILPQECFSPYDYTLGTTASSRETYAIHHYEKTWLSPWARVKGNMKKKFAFVFGERGVRLMRKMLLRKNSASDIHE